MTCKACNDTKQAMCAPGRCSNIIPTETGRGWRRNVEVRKEHGCPPCNDRITHARRMQQRARFGMTSAISSSELSCQRVRSAGFSPQRRMRAKARTTNAKLVNWKRH